MTPSRTENISLGSKENCGNRDYEAVFTDYRSRCWLEPMEFINFHQVFKFCNFEVLQISVSEFQKIKYSLMVNPQLKNFQICITSISFFAYLSGIPQTKIDLILSEPFRPSGKAFSRVQSKISSQLYVPYDITLSKYR